VNNGPTAFSSPCAEYLNNGRPSIEVRLRAQALCLSARTALWARIVWPHSVMV
jgi:hypothetical protein